MEGSPLQLTTRGRSRCFHLSIFVSFISTFSLVGENLYVLNVFPDQYVPPSPAPFSHRFHMHPPGSCSSSDRLPPLSKHVVDEFGHGLGAAVAPLVGPVLQLLHHLPDKLGEEDGDVLVALGRRHLLEVAAVLLRQASAFVFADLPGVTQVLFVPHQAHGNIRLPAREAPSVSFPGHIFIILTQETFSSGFTGFSSTLKPLC